MPSSDEDCLGCKLTSFLGLTGSGIYIATHVKNQPGIIGKGVLSIFSAGLIYFGIARLAKLPPFYERNHSIQQDDN